MPVTSGIFIMRGLKNRFYECDDDHWLNEQ